MAKLNVHGDILFTAVKFGELLSGTKFKTTDQVMGDGRVLTKTQFMREGKLETATYKIKRNAKGLMLSLDVKDLNELKLWFSAFGYSVE